MKREDMSAGYPSDLMACSPSLREDVPQRREEGIVTVLARYEAMARITGSMVEAARANDWDRLTDLGAQISCIRDELVRETARDAALGEGDRVRKAALILNILGHDQEIRRHVEPWLESAREMLSDAVRARSVSEAYGTS